MEVKINLSAEEHKELVAYCNLNDLLISAVVKNSFTTGFNIERYGLLNSTNNQEKEVIKEVIVEKRVEIPVETIKEVVKVEFVEVEKPVEIIKEVEKIVEKVIEVPIEKIVKVSDDSQINELLSKIQQLENQPEKTVEVIREVPVEVIKEVIIEKASNNDLQPKLEALQNTVQKLRQENIDKDKKIKEYEKMIQDIQAFQEEKKALFLRGSNLDDKLYK